MARTGHFCKVIWICKVQAGPLTFLTSMDMAMSAVQPGREGGGTEELVSVPSHSHQACKEMSP